MVLFSFFSDLKKFLFSLRNLVCLFMYISYELYN